ncbi:hypothetical protein [Ornithinimicrobium cerasi]|uniref:hypothetical protein n=1 Tax=Ornithinimicrobium cerasi TaxID=2248773 RepID=UPI000F00300C|nr:hypothetical protein [Ornithinimicrobium cerasi]
MDWSWLPPLLTVAGTLGGVALGDRLRGRSEERGRKAEDERRFHDDRRTLYAAWLAHLDKLEDLDDQMEVSAEEHTSSEWRSQLAELSNKWLQEASRLRSQISLVGNQAVMDSLDYATDVGVKYLWRYAHLPTDGTAISEEDLRGYQHGSNDFGKAFLGCVNAMRLHIGEGPLDHQVAQRGGALASVRIVDDV